MGEGEPPFAPLPLPPQDDKPRKVMCLDGAIVTVCTLPQPPPHPAPWAEPPFPRCSLITGAA